MEELIGIDDRDWNRLGMKVPDERLLKRELNLYKDRKKKNNQKQKLDESEFRSIVHRIKRYMNYVINE